MAITSEIFAGASGKTVVVRFLSDGAPTNLTSATGDPTIVINGGSPVALTRNLWESRTEDIPSIIRFPHIFYWLPSGVLSATDVVAFTDSGGGPAAIAVTLSGPDWGSVSGSGYRGDYAYASAGDGSSDALWTFTGLTPGTYRVSATWVEHSNRATNTPFIVYDNTTPFATVRKTQETAPNDFMFDGVNWEIIGTYVIASTTLKVRITNDADQFVIADGVLIERTDVVGYKAVGDNTASASSPAYNTVAGSVPVITGRAVDVSRVGSANGLLAPPSGRTMRLGTNITTHGAAFEPVPLYCNLMRGCQMGANATTVDANGYLLAGQASGQVRVLWSDTGSQALSEKGYPAGEEGTYTLRWYGPGDCVLASDGNATVTLTGSSTAGVGEKWRTYTVENSSSDFTFKLYVFVTDTAGLTNWRLYPPGVATDGSQKFHPNALALLRNRDVIRFMGFIPIGRDSIINYSDYSRDNQSSWYVSPERYRFVGISTIASYESTDTWFNTGWQRYLVTTTAAHGLTTGQIIRFTNAAQSITVTLDSTRVEQLYNAKSPVYVKSPTTFVVALQTWVDALVTGRDGIHHASTVNWSTAGASIEFDGSAGAPPEDAVELCNEVGADLWMSVPNTASDSCVTALFTMIATNLDSSANVYCEFGNEHWNSSLDFYGYWWFALKSAQLGLSSEGNASSTQVQAYYLTRMKEVHALARAAFVAAGRPATQVKRVCGSQWWGTGRTDSIATYCAANSIPMDYVAIAPYFGNLPRGISGFDYASLTSGEILDVLEQATIGVKPHIDSVIAAHRAALAAHGYSATEVIFYEGGIGYGGLSATAAVNKVQSFASEYHPRFKNVYYTFLDMFDDLGIPLFTRFAFNTLPFSENPESQASLYHEVLGVAMQPGDGDANLAWLDAASPVPLPSLDVAESVVSYALNAWNAATDSANVNTRKWTAAMRSRARPRPRFLRRSRPR